MGKVQVKFGVTINFNLSVLLPRTFDFFSESLTSVFIYGQDRATGRNSRDYHGHFIINNDR